MCMGNLLSSHRRGKCTREVYSKVERLMDRMRDRWENHTGEIKFILNWKCILSDFGEVWSFFESDLNLSAVLWVNAHEEMYNTQWWWHACLFSLDCRGIWLNEVSFQFALLTWLCGSFVQWNISSVQEDLSNSHNQFGLILCVHFWLILFVELSFV